MDDGITVDTLAEAMFGIKGANRVDALRRA
jgi:hypothetical protein